VITNQEGLAPLPVQCALERDPLSRWSQSEAKRVFDFVCAAPVALVALPVMLVIALLIRETSPGPALFRQRRCGEGGQEFELLKFRSMRHSPLPAGPGVTSANDSRITPMGRVLRNTKLDELPQLFNVLLGHMSLVGPRPELPEYMNDADQQSREVLELRPGITGWATLAFRHEEELLAKVPPDQLRAVYIRELMPHKARLDLDYARRATFFTDLRVLLLTLKAIVV
jgi:lipopolysaccharide/colanic/teichoic acid biosynthesis glycosyltransferase